MAQSWLDLSEITTGLVINGKVSSNVSPEIFMEPYDKVIKDIKKGKTAIEDLIAEHGINIIQPSLHAAEQVNGLGKMADWPIMLRQACNKYKAGIAFEKIGKKLQKGDSVDLSGVKSNFLELQEGGDVGYTSVDKIVAREMPFTKTGWKALDQHLCGLPEIGLVVVGGAPGQGKAQPLNSKIFTKDGYKYIGDVQMGEEIYGEDGELHRIIGVFPQGKRNVYEIEFSDKTTVLASDEHLWTIQTKGDKRRNKSRIMTTSDLSRNKLFREDSGIRSWKYFIPMTKPIKMESIPVSIHPYALGLLLGDGHFPAKGNITFSKAEPDIIRWLEKCLPKTKIIKICPNDETNYEYRINDPTGFLKNSLREYGLLGKNAPDKFVPNEYMSNSIDVRLNVLRGLIDTDGEVVGSCCMYSTSSLSLSKNVEFLVQSLGGTCVTENRQTYYTYKGEKKAGLPSYRLQIKLPHDMLPFLSDKHIISYEKGHTSPYRSVRKLTYMGEQTCVCISTDNPSKLYLTDNLIVTHNTTFAIKLGKSFLREHKDKQVYFATLEMMADEWKGRYNTIDNDPATENDICTRFLVNAKPMTLPEIIDEAATIDNLGMVLIDFVDLLVQDDASEVEMSTIYKKSMMAAKNLRCSIVLLSQFSRTYTGGIPRPSNLRYTGLAEALGYCVFTLWNPAGDFHAERDEDKLPVVEGCAYIIAWKMRGGFRAHLDDSPGAILVPWTGKNGWDENSKLWISLKKEQ